jgi:hypothetical protein
LSPLVRADGLIEIAAQHADIACGQAVIFHSSSAHDLSGTGQTRQSVEAGDDIRCH